jgi:hypothetical protein
MALFKAFSGPFHSPSHIIFYPSTYNWAFAEENILPELFFFSETSYSLIDIYLGIYPIILRVNNSNDASAPS